MAFSTSPIPDNERLRETGHDYLGATWGDYLSSVASGTMSEGLSKSLIDLIGTSSWRDTFVDMYSNPWTEPPERPEIPTLSEDQWKASPHFRKGLSFPNGVKEDVAQLLAENYDDRIRRADIESRAPGNWATRGAAQLATSLATSMLDPLNIASAFVPVVSQARYAGMLARMGKVGATVARGAIEGAAGAAMAEPFIYAAQKEYQNQDYTLADSLMNVAFGGVFGGGLHAGVAALGKFANWAHEKFMRSAIAQAADGEAINLKAVVDAYEQNRPRVETPKEDMLHAWNVKALDENLPVARTMAEVPPDFRAEFEARAAAPEPPVERVVEKAIQTDTGDPPRMVAERSSVEASAIAKEVSARSDEIAHLQAEIDDHMIHVEELRGAMAVNRKITNELEDDGRILWKVQEQDAEGKWVDRSERFETIGEARKAMGSEVKAAPGEVSERLAVLEEAERKVKEANTLADVLESAANCLARKA